VADEVRKLAEGSEQAAAEINQLSATSVRIAEEAGQMLQQLVPNIQRTAELVREISAASNEQRIGVQQINTAMQQLDQVVQRNAAASEEASAMAEELSAQADQLRATTAFFKLQDDESMSSRPGMSKGHAPTKRAGASRQPQTVEPRKTGMAILKRPQAGPIRAIEARGDHHASTHRDGVHLDMRSDEDDHDFQSF
jgi:methyl-accepting chemotaxis protein